MKKRSSFGLVWRLVLMAAVLFSSCPIGSYAKNDVSAEEHAQSEGGGIAIDSGHRYEGMNAPFAKGYEPSIQKNVMTLVIPFISEENMEKNRITVGIDFESGGECPFYYKNYRKSVKQAEEGIYLYRCRLALKEQRINGQYPLHLWAEGKGADGVIRQEFTIYVEIQDGISKVTDVGSGDGVLGDGAFGDKTFGNGGAELDGDPSEGSGMQAAEQGVSDGTQPAEEENSSQPRLMLAVNSLQGNALEAGSSSTWNVTVLNCSSRQNVENVKITLLSESKDIVFEKTSWYFEKTGPKKTMDLSQNLTVAKKASAEPVPVQFQMEYEDGKGNSYTSTEAVRLLVSQPQQAQLVNLVFPEQVYASDTEFMSFQVQNTGLSMIYNARVRLEAKGLFPVQEVFLGNIEGGSSADGEQKVFVGTLDMDAQGNVIEEGGAKYGDTAGTVIFSYENEQGEITEQKLEIHTEIQEAETIDLQIEDEKPKTNQWCITIIFFVIVTLLLIIVWLYLRMKHYQRMKV